MSWYASNINIHHDGWNSGDIVIDAQGIEFDVTIQGWGEQVPEQLGLKVTHSSNMVSSVRKTGAQTFHVTVVPTDYFETDGFTLAVTGADGTTSQRVTLHFPKEESNESSSSSSSSESISSSSSSSSESSESSESSSSSSESSSSSSSSESSESSSSSSSSSESSESSSSSSSSESSSQSSESSSSSSESSSSSSSESSVVSSSTESGSQSTTPAQESNKSETKMTVADKVKTYTEHAQARISVSKQVKTYPVLHNEVKETIAHTQRQTPKTTHYTEQQTVLPQTGEQATNMLGALGISLAIATLILFIYHKVTK